MKIETVIAFLEANGYRNCGDFPYGHGRAPATLMQKEAETPHPCQTNDRLSFRIKVYHPTPLGDSNVDIEITGEVGDNDWVNLSFYTIPHERLLSDGALESFETRLLKAWEAVYVPPVAQDVVRRTVARLFDENVQEAVYRDLLAAYAGRVHHGVEPHLTEMLTALYGVEGSIDRMDAVLLAALYHDYVYDTRAPKGENERKSAEILGRMAGLRDPSIVNYARTLIERTAQTPGFSHGVERR